MGSENVVLPSPPNIFPKMQKKEKRKNRKAQFFMYKSFGVTEKQLLIGTDTLICEKLLICVLSILIFIVIVNHECNLHEV